MLESKAPSAAGVDARGLGAFLDALEADPGIRPHGIMVLRGGAVIAQGMWAPYAADEVQLVYSLSKSFTATAVGLAVGEGLIDLDATALSYFPELDAEITDARSRAIRVRDLLAMASGHAGDRIEMARARDAENLVRGFLLLPPSADPGTLFAYNQPCTYTLATIVQRVSGQHLLDFLRPRLFAPLGIDDAAWIEQPTGQALGFSGLHVRLDAIARLGELYRRGGVWGETRILDADYVAAATSRQVATAEPSPDWQHGYGFQFWMASHGFRGDGAWGQYCVVLPEQEVVVAMTSETPNMQSVLDALWTHVLPALDGPGDAAADAELAARMASLQLPPAAGSAPRVAATAAVAASDAGVTAVRVAPGEPEWTLTLVDAAGELPIRVGVGHWARQSVAGLPIAASGGLGPDGSVEADLLLRETPHTLRVRVAGDGTATATWLTEPLHDRSLRSQHRPDRAP